MAAFLLAALSALLAYRELTGGWVLASGFAVLFFWLIFKHDAFAVLHEQNKALLTVNQRSLYVLDDRWVAFTDDGNEFRNSEHRYSVDLDTFGQGSLFQWLNRAETFLGRQTLAARITEEPRPVAVIQAHQAAIEELADLAIWRQDFQALAIQEAHVRRDPSALFAWAEAEGQWFSTLFAIVSRSLPVITIGSLAAAHWDLITWGTPTVLIIVQLSIFFATTARSIRITEEIRRHSQSIRAFARMARQIETTAFTAEVNAQLRRALTDNDLGVDSLKRQDAAYQPSLKLRWSGKAADRKAANRGASHAIHLLERLVDALDIQRIPIVHLPLNGLTLWDFHFLFALQSWRAKHGKHLRRWLTAVGEMEAITSLAAVKFDHPEWIMPQVDRAEPFFHADDLGHPLIAEDRRVANSVTLDHAGLVMVLTGSNMSGKSTFMRTVGINLILAYAGAPVCATSFSTSIFYIATSMRNTDNLEKNISSFYAELLRLRMILDAANANKPMLFLIDEIFRGTNSADRYTGAVTVLKRLSRLGTIGLVSTHDLELGKLSTEDPERFLAFHFAEHYENEQILFDYRLRPGVCPSRNAIPLMKMVGILD